MISERRPPPLSGWEQRPVSGALRAHFGVGRHSAWQCGPVCVLSSLTDAELPDRSGIGPQWQVSISKRGGRPKPQHVRKALRAFGMVGAEEDNHEPGNARHFWLPVDPAHRVACECKADESVVVDPDGYRWTNPKDGPCRGCEMAPITGRACPLHGGEE